MKNKILEKEEAMKRIYKKAYSIIGDLTPIPADCGKLCDKRCCKGDENTGMYLFPGEEAMFENSSDWLKIMESDFRYTSDKNTLLAVCFKPCKRELRPFSCRIFPLTPYIDEKGNFSVVMDKRAVSMCPLAFAIDISELQPEFTKAIFEACKKLMEYKMIRKFISAQSRLIDEYNIL